MHLVAAIVRKQSVKRDLLLASWIVLLNNQWMKPCEDYQNEHAWLAWEYGIEYLSEGEDLTPSLHVSYSS